MRQTRLWKYFLPGIKAECPVKKMAKFTVKPYTFLAQENAGQERKAIWDNSITIFFPKHAGNNAGTF